MATTAPQKEDEASANAQTEHTTTSQPQPTRATSPPQWRQPTAYVQDNPDRARAPRKFKKYQPVWVSRSKNGGCETVEATVSDIQESNGRPMYRLKDGNGKVVWSDYPSWFSESQISAS